MKKVCSNVDHNRARARAYYYAHRDEMLAKNKGYKASNREKFVEYQRIHQNNRRQRDPGFRILSHLRSRLWRLINRAHKPAKTLELIGCSREHFLSHIEGQFSPEMNWQNHGDVWELDHIKPVSSFDLTDLAQQRECFHWSNTRPLFKPENRGWT